MSKGMRVGLYVGLMLAVVALPGCGSTANYDKTQYILDPVRSAEPVAASNAAVLEVRRFTIDSAFGSQNLVYRTGDLEYETDFYHEFLVAPAAMVREATRNWLADAQLFARVVDAGNYAEPTYALEANVTALYGDARVAGTSRAVMELRVFLLKVKDVRNPVILHGKTYSATKETQTPDPNGLVVAFNACLQTILGELESDLAARL